MYKVIYVAYKAEKEFKELQSLPKDFYKLVKDYLISLKSQSESLSLEPIKVRLIKVEYENVCYMVKELFNLRLSKVVERLQEGMEIPSNLLTFEEKNLYKDVSTALSRHKEFLDRLILAEAPPHAIPKLVLVRITHDLPAFVGSDLKVYGPFKAEDVASIPPQNAEILIKRGVAELLPGKEVK